MNVVPLLFALVACRCSEPPQPAAPVVGPDLSSRSEPVTDLSSASFTDDDYARLRLEGGWVFGSGPDEVDVRFRVQHGKLVVDGPLGDYAGGLVDDVIVLRKASPGDGPPVEHWLNLAPTASGELRGWSVVHSGAEEAPVEVVLRRR